MESSRTGKLEEADKKEGWSRANISRPEVTCPYCVVFAMWNTSLSVTSVSELCCQFWYPALVACVLFSILCWQWGAAGIVKVKMQWIGRGSWTTCRQRFVRSSALQVKQLKSFRITVSSRMAHAVSRVLWSLIWHYKGILSSKPQASNFLLLEKVTVSVILFVITRCWIGRCWTSSLTSNSAFSRSCMLSLCVLAVCVYGLSAPIPFYPSNWSGKTELLTVSVFKITSSVGDRICLKQ